MRPGLVSDLGRLGQKQKIDYADTCRLASSSPAQVSLEAPTFKALIHDVFTGLLHSFQPPSPV